MNGIHWIRAVVADVASTHYGVANSHHPQHALVNHHGCSHWRRSASAIRDDFGCTMNVRTSERHSRCASNTCRRRDATECLENGFELGSRFARNRHRHSHSPSVSEADLDLVVERASGTIGSGAAARLSTAWFPAGVPLQSIAPYAGHSRSTFAVAASDSSSLG